MAIINFHSIRQDCLGAGNTGKIHDPCLMLDIISHISRWALFRVLNTGWSVLSQLSKQLVFLLTCGYIFQQYFTFERRVVHYHVCSDVHYEIVHHSAQLDQFAKRRNDSNMLMNLLRACELPSYSRMPVSRRLIWEIKWTRKRQLVVACTSLIALRGLQCSPMQSYSCLNFQSKTSVGFE